MVTLTDIEDAQNILEGRVLRTPMLPAPKLSELTGATPEACRQAIRRTLDVGRDVRLDGSPFPVFPYRLHQFFDRGDAVFASLDPRGERYLTTQGQQFVPHSLLQRQRRRRSGSVACPAPPWRPRAAAPTGPDGS